MIVRKKIPRKAVEPLTELCQLLSGISGRGETAASIFKRFLGIMSKYADYFFSQPWPKEYEFDEDTSLKDADLDFMAQGGKDEFADRLCAVCLKKNINLENGFSPLGFFWTLWAFDKKFVKDYTERLRKVEDDPAFFAKALLGWNPFPYQEKLLLDESKRIVSCWGRQCGKTSTIAVKAIQFAYCNSNVNVLIASPSLRQSMIMFDRILSFIYGSSILPKGVVKKTRTVIQLLNGSRIIALPCSENLLRGYTADMVICLPGYVKVTLASGEEVPISRIKPGQEVLSFNENNRRIEPRKVLRVFHRPLHGELIRVYHEYGYLDCTPEHKLLTANRGYIAAILLSARDKLLYTRENSESRNARRQAVNPASRIIPLWRTFRRLLHPQAPKKQEKLPPINTAFLQTSRVCSVQILNNEGLCQNPAAHSEKQGLGERISEVFHTCISSIHKSAANLLQKWSRNNKFRMAFKGNASLCIGHMVYGRWQPSLEANDDHKHPLIYLRRKSNSSRMVKDSLGRQPRDKRGQKGKGLLSAFLRGRERQIHGANQTLHYSEYELQNDSRGAFCQMSNLREGVHPPKKSLHDGKINKKKADLSRSEMQEPCAIKVALQPLTYALQNLWKKLHTAHRQPSHMQRRMQPSLSFVTQTRMEPRLQTPQTPPETADVPCLWSSLHPSEVSENLQPKVPYTTQATILSRVSTSVQGEKETVYNLEVEGNHTYLANRILVANCDEAAFMPEGVIVQVVFPMLSTTNGSVVFLSTPWGRDHFFYRAFMDPNYSVHHVKSTECPLIKPEFLEEQRRNMSDEAFRMEYLAEFVEAASCFFSQDLIRGCVDPDLEFISSLEVPVPGGEYYAGVDFGKLEDYSVIAILRREGDLLKLVYLNEFQLGTPYSNVIGHLVRANQRFQFRKVFVDQTGVGEPVLEELKAQDIQNVEGLTFTVKTKEELLTCLKLAMEQKRLKMPYHLRLCEQINEQQYEYSKSGHLTFSHPSGSHDDMLWSLALSCYAATVGREAPPRLVRAY